MAASNSNSLWIYLSAAGFLILITGFIFSFSVRKIDDYFTKRALQAKGYDVTNSYLKSALSHINLASNDVGLLLIHGFSSSRHDFDEFSVALQKRNISYYAPNMLGFGIHNPDMLYSIRYEDWLRQYLECYDVLKAHCKKVIILGNSFGAVVAIDIARYRQVDKLILLGPALIFNEKNHRGMNFISHPQVKHWIAKVIPLLDYDKSEVFKVIIENLTSGGDLD